MLRRFAFPRAWYRRLREFSSRLNPSNSCERTRKTYQAFVDSHVRTSSKDTFTSVAAYFLLLRRYPCLSISPVSRTRDSFLSFEALRARSCREQTGCSFEVLVKEQCVCAMSRSSSIYREEGQKNSQSFSHRRTPFLIPSRIVWSVCEDWAKRAAWLAGRAGPTRASFLGVRSGRRTILSTRPL